MSDKLQSDLPVEKSQGAPYKNLAHYFLMFGLTILFFAPALATVITIVFSGWPIIPAGLQTCKLLAEQNALDTMLYNNCGCAIVEILLLIVSGVVLKITTPRLIRQYIYWAGLFRRKA